MQKGICITPVANLRMQPDHKSEMVSQLLFGERFELLRADNGWYHIRLTHDQYEGWLPMNQGELLTEEDKDLFNGLKEVVTAERFATIILLGNNTPIPLSAGSSLLLDNQDTMTIGRHLYDCSEIVHHSGKMSHGDIAANAMTFLHTPYLWGGRSAFGTDCSGLVQIACKMAGIQIGRDARMQAQEGEDIHLIHEAAAGDLVFFDNEAGEIDHTGILLGKHEVIHAHGLVRIDTIDHEGIFNNNTKKYTHKLRLIKRLK